VVCSNLTGSPREDFVFLTVVTKGEARDTEVGRAKLNMREVASRLKLGIEFWDPLWRGQYYSMPAGYLLTQFERDNPKEPRKFAERPLNEPRRTTGTVVASGPDPIYYKEFK
jgi:hypothetical protein